LRDIILFLESFLFFLQHQMVVFELSPEDVLTFDVEDISDTMQSSIALSCSDTTDILGSFCSVFKSTIEIFYFSQHWLFADE